MSKRDLRVRLRPFLDEVRGLGGSREIKRFVDHLSADQKCRWAAIHAELARCGELIRLRERIDTTPLERYEREDINALVRILWVFDVLGLKSPVTEDTRRDRPKRIDLSVIPGEFEPLERDIRKYGTTTFEGQIRKTILALRDSERRRLCLMKEDLIRSGGLERLGRWAISNDKPYPKAARAVSAFLLLMDGIEAGG